MRINKLYTLSQFVFLVQKTNEIATGYDCNLIIVKYNNFLNQPMVKEMFINDLEKPVLLDCANKDVFEQFQNRHEEWMEAERKVIFNDFNIAKLHNKAFIIYNDSHDLIFHSSDFNNSLHWRKTLLEISEKTKGELTLKNVEL